MNPELLRTPKNKKWAFSRRPRAAAYFWMRSGSSLPRYKTKLVESFWSKRTLRRLGGTPGEIPLDVRFITATHRDLEKEVKERRPVPGRSLFYRLNVIPLYNSPRLRSRPNDVAQLANFFLQESCQAFDKKLSLFSDEVLQVLKNYPWPGNVRELKHVIERLVVTAKGKNLTVKDLPKEIREAKAASAATRGSLPKAEAEKQNIQKALLETNGNKSKAADRLGITRKTLFNKMKLYDLK